MRKRYTKVLKEVFNYYLTKTRYEMGISQEEMAHRLVMDNRTYSDLEHGKNCCGALTLVLFLIYVVPDPMDLLQALRRALESCDDAA